MRRVLTSIILIAAFGALLLGALAADRRANITRDTVLEIKAQLDRIEGDRP